MRRALGAALGIGLVMGAVELGSVAARGRLEFESPAALALLSLSLFQGALLGLLLGLPIELLARGIGGSDYVRQGVVRIGGLVLSLSGWLCFPEAWARRSAGFVTAELLFFALPFLLALASMIQARAWLRAAEIGRVRVGMLPVTALLALLVGLGSVIALCRPAGQAEPVAGSAPRMESARPVLFITVDTLRRDHLSIYGESPVHTPALDALAREGIRFDDAITPFPETLPAHAALFTGRHPARIGVVSNAHGLSPAYTTLAEVLYAEGYETAAFVSSAAVTGRTGLDQGFGRYDDDFFPWLRGASALRSFQLGTKLAMRLGDPTDFPFLLERPAPVTLRHADAWIRARSGEPWFAWVHLFEPHAPYEPHELPGFEENGTPEAPTLLHRDILSAEEGFDYSPAVVSRLRSLYAEEVAYTDSEIGRFVEAVRALPGPSPLIVLVGDHGEMLGEHGIYFNHHGLYEETVRVPLFIVLPGDERAGSVVDRQVRLMDVPAMVLAALHQPPMENIEGMSVLSAPGAEPHPGLASLLMGRKGMSLSEGTLYGYRAPQSGAAGCWKLHLDADSGVVSLFDLRSDPLEQQDRAGSSAATATLQAQVERETRDLPAAASGGLDPGNEEALRALGYVQ